MRIIPTAISLLNLVNRGFKYVVETSDLYKIDESHALKHSMEVYGFAKKIYESELRPEELLNGDVEAIMIYLRNTSFGPEYVINLVDPKTSKPFTATVILDELNIRQPQSKPDENGLFLTTLPKSGSTVKLKPLTYSEILELSNLGDQYPAGRVAPTVTWRLNKQIQEVDGITDKGQIAVFIESLLTEN